MPTNEVVSPDTINRKDSQRGVHLALELEAVCEGLGASTGSKSMSRPKARACAMVAGSCARARRVATAPKESTAAESSRMSLTISAM